MVRVKLIGHDYRYEINEIINLFFSNEVNYEIVSILTLSDNILAESEVYTEGKLISKGQEKRSIKDINNDIELRKLSKRMLKLSLFRALNQVINKNVPWGILTGIRPTKIVHEMLKEGMNDNEILQNLSDSFGISEEKRKLLLQIAKKESNILKQTSKDSVSLYIGIPFCPTRCLYCSFTSNSIEKYGYLMEDYIKVLIKEIINVGSIIKNNGWSVQTIYFGGGTPTSLEPEQIDKLLKVVNDQFFLKGIEEITFEAGRPDSITEDKLRVIKDYGINRISINPQTMNQETLDIIKRMHTPRDIIDKYYLAQQIGFDNINMDIIIGLPGETEVHITNTMKEIEKLKPQSITVHTMAIKRASILNENLNEYNLSKADSIQKMIEISREYANNAELMPYYLYRQKNMLGNFENVGYSKEELECIYNVQTMEEQQTIIALGAGGITKVVYDDNRIERIFNVKNVEEYINRIDEMIDRKMMLRGNKDGNTKG